MKSTISSFSVSNTALANQSIHWQINSKLLELLKVDLKN